MGTFQKSLTKGKYLVEIERKKSVADRKPVLTVTIRRGSLTAIAIKEFKKSWVILQPSSRTTPNEAKRQSMMVKFLVNLLPEVVEIVKRSKKS